MERKIKMKVTEKFIIFPDYFGGGFNEYFFAETREAGRNIFISGKSNPKNWNNANMYRISQYTKFTFPDGREIENFGKDVLEVGTDGELMHVEEFLASKWAKGHFENEEKVNEVREKTEKFQGYLLVGDDWEHLWNWRYLDGFNYIYSSVCHKFLTVEEAILLRRREVYL